MALSAEWQSDLIVMFYVLLFVAGTIIIPKLLKEKDIISKFFARKIVQDRKSVV